MKKISKLNLSRFRPAINYMKLRPGNILSEQYKHLLLLLYWPVFMVVFYYIEHIYPVRYYYPIQCFLDSLIPFNEIFVLPYVFWFALVFLMHAYTLLYDIDGFKKMIKFIIFTYSVALVTYLIFPNCQQLRPEVFERSNIFTEMVQRIYNNDTNTNVCPSIHVMGSVAMIVAVICSDTIKSNVIKIAVTVISVLICLSTVFLKQHSIIDGFAAMPVCFVAYWLFYRRKKEKRIVNKDKAIQM